MEKSKVFFSPGQEAKVPLLSALLRMYPYQLLVDKKDGSSEIKALEDKLKDMGLGTLGRWKRDLKLNKGTPSSNLPTYLPVPSLENVALELAESHKAPKDACVLGRKGSGKSTTVKRFAELIGAKIEPIVLFKVRLLKYTLIFQEKSHKHFYRT